MTSLTKEEYARLHLKAKHGMLTPEEQRVYSDYMARQLASAPPPEGGEPPKHGKPKRNVDIPNVLGKIAGVALIVAALVILGPPIARYGLELVDGLFDARDSITAQIEAVQSPSVEYYNRGGDSVYVCGDRMVWVDTWSEASHIDDKYWVYPVTSYVTAGMPMTITQYYECDRDGNIVSGPSITLSMRFSTSMSDAWSMAGMSPSAFAIRSSSLALAAQRREVRFSTWMRHMTSSSVPWNLFQPSFMCGPPFSSRGHPMPKASFKGCWPADGTRRDLQKGF